MISRLPKPVRVWLWGPISLTIAFSPLILSQAFQMMTLVVLPFSRPLFRRLNVFAAYCIWGTWAWLVQNMNGMRIVRTGDPLPHREDAIVFANHQQMGDVLVLMCLAAPVGSVGHLKWLVKDIVKYVPGVGWGMLFLDCVFLKREWRRDEASIKRVFSRIGDNKLPVWLMSFPEGTRATPAKLEKARLKWKSTYRHLLPPRQKGFTASVIGLRDHVKAVYSVTIGYHGEVPTLVGMIRGDVRVVSIDVRRTPIKELPRDEAALGDWLERDFRRKDELLESFAREGRLVEKPALV